MVCLIKVRTRIRRNIPCPFFSSRSGCLKEFVQKQRTPREHDTVEGSFP